MRTRLARKPSGVITSRARKADIASPEPRVYGQNTAPEPKPVKGEITYLRPEIRDYMFQALEAVAAVKISGKRLADAGAASPSTISNWKKNRTRSPQLVTILGTLRACGKDLKVVERQTR